jgi:glycosyltransferase involved in cell wall biosynthesis
MMSGRKIIYDVQENYFKNILYTNAFPKLLRLLIASLVRFKEIIGSIFLSGFILAEKCYEQELNFTKRNSAVIENKCKLPQGFKRTPIQGSTQLIFTGTLAESTGIFEAINLAKKLHAADSKIKLKIVGYCSLPSALQKIKDEIGLSSFITLQGGDHFISHSEIFEAIACAHFGIISYPLSPHTQDRIPTKLYEYLSCGLPILLQTNPVWEKAVAKNEAMIPFDFGGFHAQDILATMKQKTSYPSVVESQWSSEEARLLSFIKNL